MLERVTQIITMICRVISGVSFCFMAIIAFADSIGRMIDQPLLGAHEYVQFSLMMFFFSSLAFVVRDDSHIRIGLFADLYKPKLSRWEKLFTNVAELLALGLVSYMMFDQASRLDRFGTLSGYFKMPVAPWVFAAAVLSLTAVWFAAKNLWRQQKTVLPRKHAIPEEE